MAGHVDILDERESLRGALLKSFLFHAGVVGAIVAASWAGSGTVEKWGDPNSLGGGVVGITPVTGITTTRDLGRENPVANDTPSMIPSRPDKQEAVKAPEPNAIPLKSRDKKTKAERTKTAQKYSPLKDPKPNQVYTTQGQAASSPLFTPAPGSGEIGSGSGSALGNRFGWYEQILRQKVAEKWQSQDVGLQTAPPVLVGFTILRNGTTQNVRILQPSGNFTLDQSCLRAILQASPFPPLPPQYEHSSVNIEFSFRLRK